MKKFEEMVKVEEAEGNIKDVLKEFDKVEKNFRIFKNSMLKIKLPTGFIVIKKSVNKIFNSLIKELNKELIEIKNELKSLT
jgi:hypothetical protein